MTPKVCDICSVLHIVGPNMITLDCTGNNLLIASTLHIAPWCSILQHDVLVTKAKVKHTGPGADYSVSLVSEAGLFAQVSGFNS